MINNKSSLSINIANAEDCLYMKNYIKYYIKYNYFKFSLFIFIYQQMMGKHMLHIAKLKIINS